MRPDPATLEALRSLRLAPALARADGGPGERRSDRRGAGMEFVDHRPYRAGDDIRDLDHRLMARLGQPYLRQFASDQRLPVTIILDQSASMAAAVGRAELARDLAGLLAFVALAGGDAPRIWRGASRSGAEVSDAVTGAERAGRIFDWLAAGSATSLTFDALIAAAAVRLPSRGMVILISDWQDAAAVTRLEQLTRAGQEVVAIRLTAPSEADPDLLGAGVMVLEDAETGHSATLALTPETRAAYRALWAARSDAISRAARAGGGRFFDFGLDQPAAGLALGPLRRAGLLTGRG